MTKGGRGIRGQWKGELERKNERFQKGVEIVMKMKVKIKNKEGKRETLREARIRGLST